jgi:hypothetical protein
MSPQFVKIDGLLPTIILKPETIKVAVLAEKGHDEDQNGECSCFNRSHCLGWWSSQSLLQAGYGEYVL